VSRHVRHVSHGLSGAREARLPSRFCGGCRWRRRVVSCPAWVLSVGVPDYSSEAFSGGGEFVFELFDAVLGGVGLGGAGVAFGEELPVRGFQRGDPCDEFGPVGLFDLGSELQPKSSPEFVEICS